MHNIKVKEFKNLEGIFVSIYEEFQNKREKINAGPPVYSTLYMINRAVVPH